ncbi:hypothetical protein CI088_15900 [Enterococcus plantarum]|uniref:Uncharacterized protein n=1 Tax=Enterococcus plantarum TaxID=1077675 RepID=A0A2W3YRD0_9ENTE|nr:hypothetical protein [Enterococcus plantarum]PZL70131.1 hypothetical protein CI088_15900 [Enterococcus plantarum]
MTKTKEELQRELRLLEEKEQKNTIDDTHRLTVINDEFEMFEIDVTPNYDFDLAEKAKITGLIAMIEESSKKITRISNKGTKAKVYEWVEIITLLDLVFEEIFTMIYDLKDYKTPSLPNLDLFEIFLNENQDFIKVQAKTLTEQMDKLAEKYNEKD